MTLSSAETVHGPSGREGVHPPPRPEAVAVIGAGPAGLMAAEQLASQGIAVDVFDAMPSVGRKFLLAGIGGLNLTHSEPLPDFLSRFGERDPRFDQALRAFDADAVRAWAAGLGVSTFVGSSGRVFPSDMKAAPLLRAWLHRLRGQGVRLHMRHRWQGWAESPSVLKLMAPGGPVLHKPQATVLALGGASWPRLGSDGSWVPLLREHGVPVQDLVSANCGFDAAGANGEGWTPLLRDRHAGAPLKGVALRHTAPSGEVFERKGEMVLTATGIEGSLVYAASRSLREGIAQSGSTTCTLNLLPDRHPDFVAAEVARPRGSRSLSTHLKSRLGLDGAKAALLFELVPRADWAQPKLLAAAIQNLPICLTACRPIAEAISSAGGVVWAGLDDHCMLNAMPGVFCAGEMLDWDAPTGGYLLTACLATGRAAGQGALNWLSGEPRHLAGQI